MLTAVGSGVLDWLDNISYLKMSHRLMASLAAQKLPLIHFTKPVTKLMYLNGCEKPMEI